MSKLFVSLTLFCLFLCVIFDGGFCDRKGRIRKIFSSSSRKYAPHKALSSFNRKQLLLTGGAALLGLYISSKLGRRNKFQSYNDFDDYTVCEGYHLDLMSNPTESKYKYYLCPDSPYAYNERYCCETNGYGYCCSYTTSMTFGNIAGICVVLLFIGIIVYIIWRCFNRRKQRASLIAQPINPTNDYVQDPPSTAAFPTSTAPAWSYPPTTQLPAQPSPLGSAWSQPPPPHIGFPPPYSAT